MERSRLLVTLSFTAIAFASPIAAQWNPVPSPTPPPARFGAALAPWQNGELLLFGGDATNPAVSSELSWNGIRWAPVLTPIPRRDFAAIARNEIDGALWVCGGLSSTGTTLNDTWRFAAGTWTQLFPAIVPTNQPVFMAHDPVTGDMILLTQGPALGFETWRNALGEWAQVNTFTAAAPVVALFADTVRSEVCLVTSGATMLTVSRLAGLAWQDVAQIPSTLLPTWAAFDSGRGRAVVVQAQPAGPWRTFEYDGVRLVAQPVVTLPSTVGADRGALSYHAERHEVLLAGGAATLETWRWAAGATPMASPYGAPCVLPSFQLGLAPGDSPEPGGVHRLLATGGNASALTLSVIGFSHVQSGGLPLPLPIPIGALGCELRVEALALNVIGVGTPAQQVVALPNAAILLGARYDAQCVQFDATGVVDATNGLEVQIGRPLPANVLLETFASDSNRDPIASGDVWSNGNALPVAIGGDGRHGSFHPALGTSTGGGVFVWSTDNFTVPAANTLTGVPAVITDGRFFFTDFVLPAGTTLKFTGLVAAQIHVRGKVDIQGTIDASGAAMPFNLNVGAGLTPPAPWRLTAFNARQRAFTPFPAVTVAGQEGGLGGPGGGKGGNGGTECIGTALPVNNGQPGQAVQLLPGHAYAGAAASTAGLGSVLAPAIPALPTAPFILVNPPTNTIAVRRDFSPGGSGGGFLIAGGATAVPFIAGTPTPTQPALVPAPNGGAAFALFPYPPASAPAGYQSLTHFLVGGAGGGGGGSQLYASQQLPAPNAEPFTESFSAGHGGTGGGGAVAIRAGGDVTVAGTSQLLAKGGVGVFIDGDDHIILGGRDLNYGVSSPGGGGSGGSFVLQSSRNLVINGTIDTSGSIGSRTGQVTPQTPYTALIPPGLVNVIAQGGAGSPGFYRAEAAGSVTWNGTGVPAWNPAANSGVLTDQDPLSGSRSLWLLPPAGSLPYWLRYELVVDVAGQTLVFSDDPAVSALAAQAPSPVQLRFQGAQLDLVTGQVVPGTVGPWRSQLMPGSGSANRDRAQALRFDLVLDKTMGAIVVRELRLVWR